MRTTLRFTTALLVILVAAGCSSDSDDASPSHDAPTTTTSIVPAPEGLPEFYTVPTPLPAPGTLIKSEKVDAPDLHGTVYRVMYSSSTVRDSTVAVTGLIAVPNTPKPADGFPVVTWAHGTNGMADECAPSLDPAGVSPLANGLLDKGWLVTATDYEGEGTPGLHPYIAGENAARNTIDIVRAAQQLPDAPAGDDYVVWGHSQGGHTAMFALKIAPTYATDLQPKGVVAGAPPSQFALIYNYLRTSPFRYYLLMAAGGLNAAYGDDAPLEEVLTPEGMKLVPELDKGCAGDLAEKFGDIPVDTVAKGDPFTIPKWKKILIENDPQEFTEASPLPLLMIQGGNDEQIPPVSTQLLADHLCEIDQNFARWIYPGQSHSGVIGPSATDMTGWIADRFADAPEPHSYEPTGAPDIEVTRCPE
jgi:fermentation-respiration switch protein FrsA (DUF1100 family)